MSEPVLPVVPGEVPVPGAVDSLDPDPELEGEVVEPVSELVPVPVAVSELVPVDDGEEPLIDPLRPWRIRAGPLPDACACRQSFIMRACSCTCFTSALSFASSLIVAPLLVFSTFTSVFAVIMWSHMPPAAIEPCIRPRLVSVEADPDIPLLPDMSSLEPDMLPVVPELPVPDMDPELPEVLPLPDIPELLPVLEPELPCA